MLDYISSSYEGKKFAVIYLIRLVPGLVTCRASLRLRFNVYNIKKGVINSLSHRFTRLFLVERQFLRVRYSMYSTLKKKSALPFLEKTIVSKLL